jgi:melatonin receptor type 1A
MTSNCGENVTECIENRSDGVVLIESVASVIITIVCFVGNLLVCVCVYRDKHLRTVPNLFIVNLAITNILLSATVWPFWTVSLTTGEWSSTQAACDFQGFQNHCLMTSLTLTMAALGLNRYIMLVYPFHYRIIFKRRNAYKMLVVQWFLSLLWAFLRFAHLGGYEFVPKIGLCSSRAKKSASIFDIIALVLLNILTLFCYYKVFTIIRRHISSVVPQGNNTPWPPATGPKAYYYEEVNFTKTSMLIFFAYGLSWLPLILLAILSLADVEIARSLMLTSWFLIALSCAIHPIINIASNKLFRKGFYQVLCSCGFDYEANVTTRLDGAALPGAEPG